MTASCHSDNQTGGMAITSTLSNSTSYGPYEDRSDTNLVIRNTAYGYTAGVDFGALAARTVNEGGKNVSPFRVRARRQKNKAARKARRRNRK